MKDIIFVLAILAFFAICVAYVNWCDRIIGPDDFGTTEAVGAESGAVDTPTSNSTTSNAIDNPINNTTEVTA